MAFTGTSIAQRFPTSVTVTAHTFEMRVESNAVHAAIVETAGEIEALVPDGRWKSLALTALEEALMWADKAIFNERRPDELEPDGE